MKLYEQITLKKITALLFVVTMLFIHVVKAFHHHNDSCTVSSSSVLLKSSGKHISFQENTIAPLHKCAICDFHFLKDADNTTVAFQIFQQLFYLIKQCFLSRTIFSFVLISAQFRGPPADNA